MFIGTKQNDHIK